MRLALRPESLTIGEVLQVGPDTTTQIARYRDLRFNYMRGLNLKSTEGTRLFEQAQELTSRTVHNDIRLRKESGKFGRADSLEQEERLQDVQKARLMTEESRAKGVLDGAGRKLANCNDAFKSASSFFWCGEDEDNAVEMESAVRSARLSEPKDDETSLAVHENSPTITCDVSESIGDTKLRVDTPPEQVSQPVTVPVVWPFLSVHSPTSPPPVYVPSGAPSPAPSLPQ